MGKTKNIEMDFSGGPVVKNPPANMYTIEYYSAIKRNEIELFVVRWMDLESVILSEISQREKDKYHMILLTYGI